MMPYFMIRAEALDRYYYILEADTSGHAVEVWEAQMETLVLEPYDHQEGDIEMTSVAEFKDGLSDEQQRMYDHLKQRFEKIMEADRKRDEG